jgi:hypothetical protein
MYHVVLEHTRFLSAILNNAEKIKYDPQNKIMGVGGVAQVV